MTGQQEPILLFSGLRIKENQYDYDDLFINQFQVIHENRT